MYLGKDPFSGKVRLSRKALLPKPHNTMNHEDFVEKFLSPSKNKRTWFAYQRSSLRALMKIFLVLSIKIILEQQTSILVI